MVSGQEKINEEPECTESVHEDSECIFDEPRDQKTKVSQEVLCKTKNNALAEYTLRDMAKPIGLAEYRLTESLPENLKIALPSIEELEKT